MTRQVLESGTVLKERYVIDELMGMGGFANAYRAWDPLLDVTVAIKEYREDIPRFLEEARITARFRSCTDIIYVYDFFEENGAAYIVMEFLKGHTLKERLEAEEKIPRGEAISITLAVLSALETVHEDGMVHRDVAPDNVFLLPGGKVKLFDFGCAGKTGVPSAEVVVKKGYSPAEQYLPETKAEPSCDIYAAAAMLLRMLSGKRVQPAPERKSKDRVRRMIRSCTKGRRKLRRVLYEAMQQDASQRLKSAKEFAGKLKESEKEKRPIKRLLILIVFAAAVTVSVRKKSTETVRGKETGTETGTEAAGVKVSEPVTGSEHVAEPEPAAESESGPQAVPEAGTETESERGTETESESEEETGAELPQETASKESAKTPVKTEAKTQPETQPETQPVVQPEKTQARPAPAGESTVTGTAPTVPDPEGW